MGWGFTGQKDLRQVGCGRAPSTTSIGLGALPELDDDDATSSPAGGSLRQRAPFAFSTRLAHLFGMNRSVQRCACGPRARGSRPFASNARAAGGDSYLHRAPIGTCARLFAAGAGGANRPSRTRGWVAPATGRARAAGWAHRPRQGQEPKSEPGSEPRFLYRLSSKSALY